MTLSRFLAATLVFVAAGCGPDKLGERALFDDRLQPDILVEDTSLSVPPAISGNRFLSGWWPIRPASKDALYAMEGGARVEITQLSHRARTLAFDLADGASLAGGVLVRIGNRDQQHLEVSDPLVIDLPAAMPLGRIPVELVRVDGSELIVRSASLNTALVAGQAQIDGNSLSQTGNSLVDLVRWVEPRSLLVGSFEPPVKPMEGQELSLIVEREAESRVAFRWRPSRWDRLRGQRRFVVDLGSDSGFVRIRLLARGRGPAADWNQLTIMYPSDNPTGELVAVPPTPPHFERPELVLLYVMDALRADYVGHLGGPSEVTPTLDRLAREGLTFRNHRSVAPNTLPSTKALLTGRAVVEGGGAALPDDEKGTLAEAFRNAGYATGLFSNNPYVSATYGVDRGFDVTTAAAARSSSFHDDAARVHAAALAWVDSLDSSQPVFLYLHVLHPHNPYEPPESFRERFADHFDGNAEISTIDGGTATLVDIQRQRRSVSLPDRARLKGLYAASLAYNDAELAELLRGLGERYPPASIVLAATSDHGEELFEHGGVLHGYSLYEEMIRIPLVLWGPGRFETAEIQRPTNSLDLHATLVGLVGGATRSHEGRSLLESPRSAAAVHFAAAASLEGGIFSVQSQRYKLVWAPRTGRLWGMGEARGRSRDAEYLFDLIDDPEELINQAGYGGIEADWLRAQLRAWVASKRRSAGTEPTVDEDTRRRLRELGYIE